MLKADSIPSKSVLERINEALTNSLATTLNLSKEDIRQATEFYRNDENAKLDESRRIIVDQIIECNKPSNILFSLAFAESGKLLNGYNTLDDEHRNEIKRLMSKISNYTRDKTRKRPLNVLMLASPGSGKSHFIKKLVDHLADKQIEAVMYNMANLQSTADLAQPLDESRNVKINDKIPLLFLDEFDSKKSNYPTLLPLLWDGELQIGDRDLKLGKSVIVLAGSTVNAQLLGKGIKADEKLNDLVSRINGGIISIPDLNEHNEHRDRRVDKVCVSISLLRSRFGNNLSIIPRSLLTFISNTEFCYGARSITSFLDFIDVSAVEVNNNNAMINREKMKLPISSLADFEESNLSLHLSENKEAVLRRWKNLSQDTENVKIRDLTPREVFMFNDLITEKFIRNISDKN